MFQALFWSFSPFCPFFPNFFARSGVSGVEKRLFHFFFGNCKNDSFLPKLTQIWPKWPKWRFFTFFWKMWISYFFAWSIVSGVEKNEVITFLGKFQNCLFCPKLTQIWPKFGQNIQKLLKIRVYQSFLPNYVLHLS